MESSTVAAVLALTLACTGGMFLVISHQMQGRNGMATFALGLTLFGLVFAIPESVDRLATLPLGVLIDSLAVAAVLLLRRGLRRFMQRSELNWRPLLLLLLAFVLISGAARWMFGLTGRQVALSVTLALLFAWLAWGVARDAFRDNPMLRVPLMLLSTVLAALALLSLGEGLTILREGAVAPGANDVYDVILMLSALLLGPSLLWMHTVQLTRQLGELGTRDPLTRLLNENGFNDVLRRHFARRQHEPVVLMHVDVDRFARVNDLHGEAAGDDVLRMVGLALESGLRADDLVARVGGEEFIVACIGGDVAKAAVLAERLRVAVAAVQTGLNEGNGHLRVTVGVGLSRPFTDMGQWHTAWDEAALSLQAAKDAGSNCVVHPTSARAA